MELTKELKEKVMAITNVSLLLNECLGYADTMNKAEFLDKLFQQYDVIPKKGIGG